MRRLRQQDKTNRFVFMNERGAPMTAAGFRKMLARVRQAAGLDVRAHPHMLRHACGYHLANKGKHTAEYSMFAPQSVQELLGGLSGWLCRAKLT